VSPVLAAFAVAVLATVAAAGVTAGFRRRDPAPIEPFGDPLDDRRLALARSFADLEEAHRTGALEELDYHRLRTQTEARMARVLRAIDERRASAPPLRAAVAADPPGAPGPRAGRVPPWAVGAVLVTTVLAVVAAGLLRDAEPQPTATAPTQASQDPLAFFEQRVRDHPNDLAARLDLAHRYLDAGRLDAALAEYAVALELDPDDAEAHAHVAIILAQSDRPEDALAEVDRALESAPDYPEALFVRGFILLDGLDRPADAIEAFRAYLAAAPFGSERRAAQDLIAQAREAVR
jgi:cytochrome c-type biogenesis protein CcmH/NrfG